MSRDGTAVVIPTLDRLGDLRRCLDAVRRQELAPDAVIVVDNGSTDGTRVYLADQDDVTPLLPEENVGAPGGFAEGMRAAFTSGLRWTWLLDDDAVPAPDALEQLLARVAEGRLEGRVGGAAPTVEFADGRLQTGWLWGRRADGGRGQSPNVPGPEGRPPASEVDWAPFAGLLLARDACEDVGPIRSDYFLWHADVEYCLRLRAAGWRLLAAPLARVRHPAMPMVRRRVLRRTLAVGAIPPWREYYDTRNRCLLLRGLRGTGLEYGLPLWRRAWEELKRTGAVMVVDRAGPRRVGMRLLGLIDGLRGYMGQHPERRPAR